MNPEQILGTHLSDDDLIAFMYAGETGNVHLSSCAVCLGRLTALQKHRAMIERHEALTIDITPAALAKQRREIYAQLSASNSFWSSLFQPKWISAVTTALVLGGGLLVFENRQQTTNPQDTISDAALAQEVSQMSQTAEPMPAEPLKGLFE